jgi:hypothetical protein
LGERAREEIEKRAEAWAELQKIEKWRPNLYAQRDEAAERLEQLEALIAEEQAEAVRLRAIGEGRKPQNAAA